jgi:hypothetical protein
MILPVGTTGQRGSSIDGNLRYNSTTASFEGYANGAWGSIVSGSGVNSISFGSTGLTPSTSTTGNVTVAGTLVVANGGTGVTTSTGTTNVVLSNSPTLVTPNLGTPSFLLGTNITGTATAFTASNVTTNANLTGDVTSVGNATAIAAGVIVNADINASAAIDFAPAVAASVRIRDTAASLPDMGALGGELARRLHENGARVVAAGRDMFVEWLRWTAAAMVAAAAHGSSTSPPQQSKNQKPEKKKAGTYKPAEGVAGMLAQGGAKKGGASTITFI